MQTRFRSSSFLAFQILHSFFVISRTDPAAEFQRRHTLTPIMLRAGETLLRRRNSSTLPTNFAESSPITDGSVRSIKLDAPLTKAIKSADNYIKGTYVWLLLSILSIYYGSVWIYRSSASMSLDCNNNNTCTLFVRVPKGYHWNGFEPARTTSVEIKREQIVRADNIKWDPKNHIIVDNYGLAGPPSSYNTNNNQQQQEEDKDDSSGEEGGEGGGAGGSGGASSGGRTSNKPWKKQKGRNKKYNKYKKKKNSGPKGMYYTRTGPDENGNYDSYIVVLRDLLPPSDTLHVEEDVIGGEHHLNPNDEGPSKMMQRQMAERHEQMLHDPTSFASRIGPFAILSHDSLEYIIHLRDFNVDKTHRLARTTVSKINAYVNKKRTSFIIREERPVMWQGLVLLILGIFSFVLCLLLGIFWEEYDPTKHGSFKKRMAEMRKLAESKKRRMAANAARKSPQRTNIQFRDRPNPITGRKAY